jgi:hypothetical protein
MIEREDLRDTLHKLFVKTNKYHDVPAKRGEPGGMFGIFVDPDKCKAAASASLSAARTVPWTWLQSPPWICSSMTPAWTFSAICRPRPNVS